MSDQTHDRTSDFTEEGHSLADLQLAESEQRYRAVIDNASDMIQSVRPDGTFEFVNQAWLDTLGYTADEVPGLTIWNIVHDSSLEHCSISFQRALSGEQIPSMQAVFAAKDGHPIPVEGSVTSRYLGDAIVATHGFFRDTTVRQRAEDLERRNAQLVRDEQARRLEKMAALGKLSAGLAHELNNPAAAVLRATARLVEALEQRETALKDLVAIGMTPQLCERLAGLSLAPSPDDPAPAGQAERHDLDPIEQERRESDVEAVLDDLDVPRGWTLAAGLVRAHLTPDDITALSGEVRAAQLTPMLRWVDATSTTRESVEILTRSSHRISELVSAVKGYTHMDRAVEQHVDLHDGIESTLTILGHGLGDVTVRREYDRSIPPVRALGNTLNQVWTNILDNAIDAVGGRGTITIRTRRDADRAVVEIEDDGEGIPAEVRSRIFEPFFTTKAQGHGTGLGLDTAWRIVNEEHGGTIDVDSPAGGGTRFTVTVPVG